MTTVAFGPIATAMHILQLMAKRACRADALVALAGMTGLAIDFLVRPGQREWRFGMIERLDGLPGVIAVAIGAFFTQPAFVRLIGFMAIDAERRRLPIGLGGFMASLATLGLVRSLEREIRKAVIEGLAVERRDLRFASLMFGVAMFALRIDDLRHAPVQALPPLFVGRDLLMAIQAKFALRGL